MGWKKEEGIAGEHTHGMTVGGGQQYWQHVRRLKKKKEEERMALCYGVEGMVADSRLISCGHRAIDHQRPCRIPRFIV